MAAAASVAQGEPVIEVGDTVKIGDGRQRWVVLTVEPGDMYGVLWYRRHNRHAATEIIRTEHRDRLTFLRKGNAEQDRHVKNCKDLGWHGTPNCYCGSFTRT